jgi:hypothetical protein
MMLAGTERPRFRQDLFAESVDEQGATFVDVMDPDSGRVFRFYEVEFSIACAMDGERDVPGLVKWAQDELGVTPSTHEIQTVIATLGELGYLDPSGAAKAAATDVPAASGRATSGLAAGPGPAADTVVDTPALKVPARTPIPVEEAPPRAAAAAGNVSEVSLDLSEHLAVGREDVQEAVRQSRVMAAVEVPPELIEPASSPAPTPARPERPTPAPEPLPRPTPAEARRPAAAAAATKPPARPTPPPVEAKQPERAVEAKQPERAVEAKQPERPVEAKQPERPVEAKQPERPVEAKQPERPVETKQPERPVEAKQPEHKAPVTLPKVPEKQPVAEAPPSRTASTVVFVILILVVLGIGGFLVWKLVLDKPAPAGATGAVGAAPVAPQPAEQQEPPGPPAKPSFTSKIEMSSGRPKTLLSYWAGTIEWVETSGKELKTNDVILKLAGYKPLEAQVAALEKEQVKVLADREAAYQARDAVSPTDEAAMKKAQAKVDAAEKAANTKSDQLLKKTDQLEKHYVRLNVDGTVTLTRKVGEKIGENAPVATVVPVPEPSATFKIPANYKFELGVAMPLSVGERLVTCQVADWEPEKIRITCPPESGVAEGATATWQIP